jgi:hypothetical protein
MERSFEPGAIVSGLAFKGQHRWSDSRQIACR